MHEIQEHVFIRKTFTLHAGKQILFRVPEVLGDRSMSQTAVKKLVVSMSLCAVG